MYKHPKYITISETVVMVNEDGTTNAETQDRTFYICKVGLNPKSASSSFSLYHPDPEFSFENRGKVDPQETFMINVVDGNEVRIRLMAPIAVILTMAESLAGRGVRGWQDDPFGFEGGGNYNMNPFGF